MIRVTIVDRGSAVSPERVRISARGTTDDDSWGLEWGITEALGSPVDRTLPAGWAEVRVSSGDRGSNTRTVFVEEGKVTDLGEWVLGGFGELEVIVRDSTGQVMAGKAVRIEGPGRFGDSFGEGTTRDDGVFRLSGVPEGPVLVCAMDENRFMAIVEVRADDVTRVELGGTVQAIVEVKDCDTANLASLWAFPDVPGAGLLQAVVGMSDVSWPGLRTFGERVGAWGTYELCGLEPGRWWLVDSLGGFTSVLVDESPTTRQSVVIHHRWASVKGVTQDGERAFGLRVTAIDMTDLDEWDMGRGVPPIGMMFAVSSGVMGANILPTDEEEDSVEVSTTDEGDCLSFVSAEGYACSRAVRVGTSRKASARLTCVVPLVEGGRVRVRPRNGVPRALLCAAMSAKGEPAAFGIGSGTVTLDLEAGQYLVYSMDSRGVRSTDRVVVTAGETVDIPFQ